MLSDRRLSIDPLKWRNVLRPYGMIIGDDFLTAHRVLLSVEQKRFYFSYLGGRVFDVEPSVSRH